MRRLLACLALAGIVGGATIGFATGIDIQRSYLASGGAPVQSCDPDGIDVHYELGWRGRVSIERVSIEGIGDACVGLSVTVVMIVAGKPVELGPAPVSRTHANDNSVRLDVPGGVPALDLERLHVAIT